MSRIHEALKRAEREKATPHAPEPVHEPAPPAAQAAAPAPAVQPVAAVQPPAAVPPAAVAAPAPAPGPVAPLRVVPPGTALLECCRRSRWHGDTAKLFFLSARHNT
ncbi:MAG TPA: hypothetical protein VJW51_01570, partial [Candidatus Acidoferrales bacterium]|nr:hypothetical protein [Candidatus Acidoferrales bacterium]